MMVGSVRGNERLEMVVRVLHSGRCADGRPCASSAASVGGHARLAPPLTDSVGCPHVPQKVLRVFQSSSARACA